MSCIKSIATSTATAAVLAMLVAASANAQPVDPNKLKDQITGDAKGPAAANPQCKLFTVAEITALVGAPVGPGENAAGGLGCSWHSKDYAARASVSVVPPNYFPEPSGVRGFKPLPGIGSRGWAAPDDGWSAGAVVQDMGVVVVISGKAATEASVVGMLRQAIERRKK
ncbi:MAG: hypothetical protein ABJB17_02640 [Burkholderiales bacterium]